MPHVHETITIDAHADEVWSLAGDLGGISNWHPAVATSEASDGHRHCVLEGGGEIEERILEHSPLGRYYVYEIVDSPMPVSSYHSRFTVREDGDRAAVDWELDFEPADPSQVDEVTAAMSDSYRVALIALREQLEQSALPTTRASQSRRPTR
jgi:hypothetical protein